MYTYILQCRCYFILAHRHTFMGVVGPLLLALHFIVENEPLLSVPATAVQMSQMRISRIKELEAADHYATATGEPPPPRRHGV